MTDVKQQLEQIESKVMGGLKDFQKETVNRIAYLFTHGQRRVLVSDEVGLGKTLIARGVVAKTAKIRRDENDDLFRVVYICSNGAIAEQNLRKLRITREAKTESVLSSRLSMQHLKIYNQDYDSELRKRFIQLIPLTPDTSFRVTGGPGTYRERALMYAILWRVPELAKYKDQLNDMMKWGARASWDQARIDYEYAVTGCDKISGGKYFREMTAAVSRELAKQCDERETYFDKLLRVCRAAEYGDRKYDLEYEIIGKLRMIFARISLDRLEPDLVIMDEFQRFRFLLDAGADSDIGMLTRKFFHSGNVRMLLLSATPYKMYSTPEEIDEDHIDQHYEEFLMVMNFLNEKPDLPEDVNEKRKSDFLDVWKDYSVRLREMTLGDLTVLSAKRAAEDEMYRSVCRTERISESRAADLVDDASVKVPVSVMEQDIFSFVQAQKLFDDIEEIHVPVDYVKSCPYLMSFMQNYQLKKKAEAYFRNNPDQISKVRRSTLWLNRNAMDRYEKIPSGNARLEQVTGIVLQKGMEKLLWIPPSRPYYDLQGPFKGCGGVTKTLVFSSWEMVPRMLACMLSYEAERKTVGTMISDYRERDVHYFAGDDKRYPPPRLRFAVNALTGEPRSMTLFCLLYPSEFLTEVYDPVRMINAGMTLQQIRKEIRGKIEGRLGRFASSGRGQEDAKWYSIAPLLLDRAEYAFNWLENSRDLADDEEGDKKRGQKGYIAHLDALTELFYNTHREKGMNLGRQPSDLFDVLVDMALGSPAVCIRRTLLKYAAPGQDLPIHMPGRIARVFVNRMNTPESIAAVELTCGRRNKEDAHWQNLLTYGVQGNLQAVFDEYAHLVSCGIDQDETLLDQLYEQIREAMDIRSTSYVVDTFNAFKRRISGKKERGDRSSVRTHFAVAFTKGENRESDADRKRTIRNAFNSPFRPFVLATTSIGQEGLDFHQYCRRIVHWNLPANPIDLEQREGRINRFECHAIRQNIAARYGYRQFREKDIWKEMFETAAKEEKTDGSSDLIPYWGVTDRKGTDLYRIERIVPMYPFSRDGAAYERLIRILSMYRLTLGQARQEELLEYLFRNCDDPEKLKELFINLSPFYKKYRE